MEQSDKIQEGVDVVVRKETAVHLFTVKAKKYANFLPSDFQTEVLNHIFDPVIIGRFFLGTDARNSRIPFSKRGLFDKSDESFNPSYHKLTIDKYMKIRIQSLFSGREIFLGNIHVHSKRIPKNINRLRKLLIKESNKKRNLVLKFGRIDFLVSAERIGSFVRRKLKMVNSDPSVGLSRKNVGRAGPAAQVPTEIP